MEQYAFVQNLRRGHDELGLDTEPGHRLEAIFTRNRCRSSRHLPYDAPILASVTCPKCHGRMRTIDRQGVHIEQCENCRGIFLDHGELEHLLAAEDRFYGASHYVPPGGHRGKPDSPRPYRGGHYSDSPRPYRGEPQGGAQSQQP